MLGVGATYLPANFSGGDDRSRSAAPQGAPASVDVLDQETLDEVTAAPEITPSATATTAAPTPSRTRASRTPAPTRARTPAASRATTRAAATNGDSSAAAGNQQEQVVAIVNRERAAAGCAPVQINERLTAAAQQHSEDQAANNTMSHTGSDGSNFVERARRAGYQDPIGENVAMGYRTPEAVMDGWMNSDGHRRNILNCQARAIGVGVAAASDGALYWTQVFGATV